MPNRTRKPEFLLRKLARTRQLTAARPIGGKGGATQGREPSHVPGAGHAPGPDAEHVALQCRAVRREHRLMARVAAKADRRQPHRMPRESRAATRSASAGLDIGPAVVLAPGREKSLRLRHPWLFSGAVARVDGNPGGGETVKIVDSDAGFLAYGAYSPASQIRARVWSFATSATSCVPGRHGFRRNMASSG